MSRVQKSKEDIETVSGRHRDGKSNAAWDFWAGPGAEKGHQRKAGEAQMLAHGAGAHGDAQTLVLALSFITPGSMLSDIRRG